MDSVYLGIDGCSRGWICAILSESSLDVKKYNLIESLVIDNRKAKAILVDMPIGLPDNKNHIRPDVCARQIIPERMSTIFPVPCRKAVYANAKSEAYQLNESILGKKFTPLTFGIMPKIKELDIFLQNNEEFKNIVIESHPELCFSRMNKKTLLSKKNRLNGILERIELLKKYIPEMTGEMIGEYEMKLDCNADDVLDAICLSVTAKLHSMNETEIIPSNPQRDDTGILMQMIIPK